MEQSCFQTSVLGSLYNTVSDELKAAGLNIGKYYCIDNYNGINT